MNRLQVHMSASLGELRGRVSDALFARFQSLVHREAGIWLAPAKKDLLVGRLARRLRERGLASYGDYFQLVQEDLDERVHMLDCISTNETHFFREPHHFEFLEQRLLPAWRADADAGRRPRRLRVWSAACSTGEEPYSLAMTLLRALPPGSGWTLEIFASDLSTRALQGAARAVWPLDKSAEIPLPLLKAFMLQGTGSQEGAMKAGPEIRALVRFARLNLNEPSYGPLGLFDLVFCRNVLIYFDAATKEAVIRRLVGHLASDGWLFLGHAESLVGSSGPLRSAVPSIYTLAQKRSEKGAGR